MMNVREEASEWIRVGVVVAVWSTLLYISKMGLAINWESVKELPTVITVYATLSYVFAKWLWRMPALQGWLVPFPDLQGTWQGEVRSTGSDADPSVPVPVVLVIKQTLSSMSVTMHTITSDSYSTTAQLSRNADGTLRLTYNYTNRPKAAVRDRWRHDGALRLRYAGALLHRERARLRPV